MDLIICGVVDIVIIVLLIIISVVGYQKGFLNKALGMVSFIVAVAVAFSFCTQLATIFKNMDIIYPSIYDAIYGNVSKSDILANPDASIVDVLVSLDIPKFIAEFVAKGIGEKMEAIDLAVQISEYVTKICMNVICFIILFVGVFVVALILKLISKILRGNAFIKFVDGILGVAFYASVYIAIIYVLFTVLHFMMDASWFSTIKEFLVVDMMLDNPDEFRISKFIYEHNVIYNLIESFL